VPKTIGNVIDAPETGIGIADAAFIPGGITTDLFTILPERIQPTPAKPAPPRVDTPAPTVPLRVSTTIQSALLIFGPKPVYPPLARAARVQGTVRLTAVIGTDGAIRNLKLISGPPLLVTASVQAVQQWRYKPTMLNGSPVEVITEIEVNFTLGQ
jgi:protein TonB